MLIETPGSRNLFGDPLFAIEPSVLDLEQLSLSALANLAEYSITPANSNRQSSLGPDSGEDATFGGNDHPSVDAGEPVLNPLSEAAELMVGTGLRVDRPEQADCQIRPDEVGTSEDG